jgi:hypothetical protein
MEGAIQGEKLQPSQSELNKLGKAIKTGVSWNQIFPGVASINITAQGYGPSIDLRISKKEGVPVVLVPEGTPGASVVAIKRVDELQFYNLGRDQMAKKLGLSGPKTTALINFLTIKEDLDCFKLFSVGRTKFSRYSPKALSRLEESLKTVDLNSVWKSHGVKGKKSRSVQSR